MNTLSYSKHEIKSISGREPLEIDASVDSEGNKVNNTVWDEVLRADASLVKTLKSYLCFKLKALILK